MSSRAPDLPGTNTALTSTESSTSRPANAPFSETHRRRIDAPIDAVADAILTVTPGEIRTFGPLITLRGLPSRLLGSRGVAASGPLDTPLLDLFESEGFVPLRRFGDAVSFGVEYGAAGRFWSLNGNAPIRFDTPDEYERFDEAGHAKIWFELTARQVTDRRRPTVEVATTTLVSGTDRAAERRFAPYWALIRLPSGLIRRSWLAAIERRALS